MALYSLVLPEISLPQQHKGVVLCGWFDKPSNSQDLICDSPYCLPYSSFDFSLENLVLDQLIIPYLIFFFILIACLLDIVLIL